MQPVSVELQLKYLVSQNPATCYKLQIIFFFFYAAGFCSQERKKITWSVFVNYLIYFIY